jgi:hypothetical protein
VLDCTLDEGGGRGGAGRGGAGRGGAGRGGAGERYLDWAAWKNGTVAMVRPPSTGMTWPVT